MQPLSRKIAAFEQKWQSNEPPTIESVLAGDVIDVERDVLLAELVTLEIDYRLTALRSLEMLVGKPKCP